MKTLPETIRPLEPHADVVRRLAGVARSATGLPAAARVAGEAEWVIDAGDFAAPGWLDAARRLLDGAAPLAGGLGAPLEIGGADAPSPVDDSAWQTPGVASIYALPIATAAGALWGTLCVLGPAAGAGAAHAELLAGLARWAADELELRHLLADRHRLERERAQLLAAERAARAQAQFAERRARFLAEAGTLLDETLDYATAFARLARLTVPTLADYCLIDEVEPDGAVCRVALAHRDPEAERLLVRDARHPPGVDPRRHPVLQVVRAGTPLFVPEVSDEVLDNLAHDEAHREKLVRLGIRSFIIAPLCARGRTLGTITLVAAESGRVYTEQDLAFAGELARRAAFALDNARLYREARAAVSARDGVLQIVSHDLRNPLATVLLNASALSGALTPRPENQWLREPLDWICTSVEQMNRLIEDLLQVSRIESGNLVVQSFPQPAGPVVADALSMMQPIAEASRVRLRADVPPDLPRVVVDRERIVQVFSNLVGNAVRFTPAGGEIVIGAVRDDGGVRFSVSDTGSGIPAEDLPHLFTRFWQGKRSSTGGSGLGLAIAKGIVEAHGGALWAESELGRGSAFHFRVPAG